MRRQIPGFVLALFVFFSVHACKDGGQGSADREFERIMAEIKSLHCQRERLEARVDKVWDDLNASLASALPSDVPAEEKAMMLRVKNAPLIRMFEVYDSLDASTHRLVDSAEMADKLAVDSFNRINGRIKELETERKRIFEQEENVSHERLMELRARYSEILNAPCAE